MNLPLNIDWHQILLHLFNFVILFAVLYFLLYKPVKKFIDKRTEHYKQLDAEAENKLSDAQKLKADYEARLSGAEAEIKGKTDAAMREISEARENSAAQAKAEAELIISKAKESADKEKEKIIEDAQKDISELVMLAAKKIAVDGATSDVYNQFLDVAEENADE